MTLPFYVSVEGVDTSGKTTLVSSISQYFTKTGYSVGLKHESPLDTDVEIHINAALNHSIFISQGFEKGPRAALLYMLYAECLAYQQVPEDVQLVIADRGVDSIAVYQGAALQSGDSSDVESLLSALENFYSSIGGRIPDLTILLLISSNELIKRFYARHGRKPAEFELSELIRLQARYQYIASLRSRCVVLAPDICGPDLVEAAVNCIESQFNLRNHVDRL